jgi:hypothetical protein
MGGKRNTYGGDYNTNLKWDTGVEERIKYNES